MRRPATPRIGDDVLSVRCRRQSCGEISVVSVFIVLFLNAQCARAGFEDCPADFPLGQRDVEEGGRLLGATGLPLLFDEGVVLLLGGIASSFFISRSVGLVRGGSAPGVERLAEEQTGPRARCRCERISFAERAAEQRPASDADCIFDKPRRAKSLSDFFENDSND